MFPDSSSSIFSPFFFLPSTAHTVKGNSKCILGVVYKDFHRGGRRRNLERGKPRRTESTRRGKRVQVMLPSRKNAREPEFSVRHSYDMFTTVPGMCRPRSQQMWLLFIFFELMQKGQRYGFGHRQHQSQQN
jgi:hypothetical protein